MLELRRIAASRAPHYNYFRDYDPSLGRFAQSDLLGLGAGTDTFTYVSGAPLKAVDVFGLYKDCVYWGTDLSDPYDEQTTSDKSKQLIGGAALPDVEFEVKGNKPKRKLPRGGMPLKPEMKIVGYWWWKLYLLTWTVTDNWRQREETLFYCRDVDGCSVGPWYLDPYVKIKNLRSATHVDWETETSRGYVDLRKHNESGEWQ